MLAGKEDKSSANHEWPGTAGAIWTGASQSRPRERAYSVFVYDAH